MSVSSLGSLLSAFQSKRQQLSSDVSAGVVKKFDPSASGVIRNKFLASATNVDTVTLGTAKKIAPLPAYDKTGATTKLSVSPGFIDPSTTKPATRPDPDPRPFGPTKTATTEPVKFIDDVPIIFVVDPKGGKIDPSTVKAAPVDPRAPILETIPGLVYNPDPDVDTRGIKVPTRVEYNSIKTVYQAYNPIKQPPVGGIGVELPPGPPKTIDEEGTISNAPIKFIPTRLPPIVEPPEEAPPIDEIAPQAGNGAADVYNPTAADVYDGRPPKLPPIVEPDPDAYELELKQKIAAQNTGVFSRPRPVGPFEAAPPIGFEPGPSAPLQPAPPEYPGKLDPVFENPIGYLPEKPLKPIFANPIAPYTPDDKLSPIYSRPIAKIDPVVDTSTQKVQPLPPKGIYYLDPIFEPYTASRSSRIEQPISLNPVNELA